MPVVESGSRDGLSWSVSGTATGPGAGAALVVRRFTHERLGLAALAGLIAIVLACFVGEPLLARLL